MTTRRSFLRSGAVATAALAIRAWPAHAENAPGVSDTGIKIGQNSRAKSTIADPADVIRLSGPDCAIPMIDPGSTAV